MKYLGTSMVFVVLVSLFCLAIPSNALAQSGIDFPCCFIAPTGMDLIINNGIQSMVSINPGNKIQLLPDIGLGLPQSGQFFAEYQVSFSEFEIPNLYVMRDREFYRGNRA
jgi:hypothetical protein